MDDFLIGKKGSDFLFEQLTTNNPAQVIHQFQADNNLTSDVDMIFILSTPLKLTKY
jgi:hypothetical protein